MNVSAIHWINSQMPPVLIVGYKRPKNIQSILRICREAGISSIFLYIDGPKIGDSTLTEITTLYQRIADEFRSADMDIRLQISPLNQGCSMSVIKAVSWALNFAEEIIVLEDDCIPSKGFFSFCLDVRDELNENPDVWLVCGSQFAPDSLTLGNAYISNYALTWGWFTNREKWRVITKEMKLLARQIFLKSLCALDPEIAFWLAGARRTVYGYTDVWDTLLIACMRLNSKKAILPPHVLVTNLGNDEVATHTQFDFRWTNKSLPPYEKGNLVPENFKCDEWIRDTLFRIQVRHSVSTKITLIRDFWTTKKFEKGFFERLGETSNI